MKRSSVDNSGSSASASRSLVARMTGFDLSGSGLVASGVSVVAAGALLLGVVPGGSDADEEHAAELPTFESLAANSDTAVRPADGLTHVIVWPQTSELSFTVAPLDNIAPEDPSGSSTSSKLAGLGQPTAADGLGELEALDNAPEGSTLVVTEKGVAVRYPDGTVVPLDDVLDPSRQPADGTDAAPGTEDAADLRSLQTAALAELPADATMAEQLAALPGVESATSVGDGSIAVALHQADALDGFALDTIDEVYLATFADPYERLEWYLDNDGLEMHRIGQSTTEDADIDAGIANSYSTGAGIVVAVIDTGVDFSHPDLAPSAWVNSGETCDDGVDNDSNGYIDDCNGYDFSYRDGEPFNVGANPHGTHVAGTIAAARDGNGVAGVAPDAKIMDLNVAAVGGVMSGSAATEAIRYAVDNGADIINLSLGTDPGTSESPAIGDAIDYAADAGVLVVVAAGNHNVDLGSSPVWPASYDKPNMMTVGATTPDDTKAMFSNYGHAVDIFAPGSSILAPVPVDDGEYAYMSGTSMAAPVTAGAAALVLADNRSLSPAEVIDLLQTTSDHNVDLDRFGADGRRVNAGEALGGETIDIASISGVTISLSGLANARETEPVSTTMQFLVPDDEFSEDYQWELTLIANETEGAYALQDRVVQLDGTTLNTGSTGVVPLGLMGSGTINLSTELPAGAYGFLIEAVSTADPDSRIGEPVIAGFTVRPETDSITSDLATGETVDPDTGSGETGSGETGSGSGETGSGATGSGETGSGETGSGETGSGETGSGETGSGETGSGETGSGETGSGETGSGETGSGGGSGTGGTTDGTGDGTDTDGNGSDTGDGTGTSPGTGSGDTTNGGDPATPDGNGNPGQQPTTPESGPGPVVDDVYSVRTVSPYIGPVDEQTRVTLAGDFPDPVQVFFGAIEATSVSQTATRIVAFTPAESTPGGVDIRLVRDGVTVLTVGNGFTYQAGDVVAGGGQTGTGTGGTTTTTVGGNTTVTTDPTGTTVTTDPGDSTGDTTTTTSGGEVASTTTTGRPRWLQPRTTANGAMIDLGSDRVGLLLNGGNPFRTLPACRTNTCIATNL